MMKLLAAAAAFALAPAALWAQGTDANHKKVYDATVDSVVAVRALAPLGERSGSGVVLTAEGLILTSYSVVPDGAANIRVWTKGPRLYEGELVATSRRDEISIVRIKPRDPKNPPAFKPIRFGDSSKIQIGDVAYTLGNASNSMINDDSPSFNVGVVSGSYRLAEERANSTFVGHVLETTAAVNVGMEGAPLLDAEGRMIGFITLNYSPNRFLGAAIPWHTLQGPVALLRDRRGTAGGADPADVPQGEGVLGATFVDQAGQVVVDTVDKGGAAAAAGLEKGVVILAIGDVRVKSARDLADRLAGLEAGTRVYLKISIDGLEDRVTVELQGKKK